MLRERRWRGNRPIWARTGRRRRLAAPRRVSRASARWAAGSRMQAGSRSTSVSFAGYCDPGAHVDVYLIDGTYELFRHFYALPSARDAEGREIAAVRGVLASVLGMINGGARYVGVATDH